MRGQCDCSRAPHVSLLLALYFSRRAAGAQFRHGAAIIKKHTHRSLAARRSLPPTITSLRQDTVALLTSEQQVIREIRTKNGVEDDLLRRAREDPALGATIHHLKDGYARALIMYVIICH